ncbi:hypothetical protein GCM10009536_62510 [Streptomyces thermocarboxydus]
MFGKGGEDGDGRAGDGADDLLGGREPVQAGHADVGRGHVGAVHAGRLDGLASVARLGDDLHLAAAVQKGAHSGPHHRLVVGRQDPDHRVDSSWAASGRPPARGTTSLATRRPSSSKQSR